MASDVALINDKVQLCKMNSVGIVTVLLHIYITIYIIYIYNIVSSSFTFVFVTKSSNKIIGTM